MRASFLIHQLIALLVFPPIGTREVMSAFRAWLLLITPVMPAKVQLEPVMAWMNNQRHY